MNDPDRSKSMDKNTVLGRMVLLLGILAFFSSRLAAVEITAVKAGRIITVTRGVIENGIILIRDGKIVAIGRDTEIPLGARIIDHSGKVIVPGLVEAHAVRGCDIPNETNPLTPFVTVRDAIDPSHDAFVTALRDGVTTMNIMPGRETILGGTGAVIRPFGLVVEDMVVVPISGMKISVAGIAPQTRMGVMAQLERYFKETRSYMEESSERASSGEPGKMVATPGSFRSPDYVKYKAVADLMRGRYRAFIYCETTADVNRAIGLGERYGFSSVLVLGPACWKAAGLISSRKVPAVLDPEIIYDERDPGTREFKRIEIPRIFRDNGAEFALLSDPAMVQSRSLLYQAMRSMSCGLSAEEALKAITIVPARILGIEGLVGSLEAGKNADFLVMDGEPLALGSKIEQVYIEGNLVYERDKDEQWKVLTGEKPVL